MEYIYGGGPPGDLGGYGISLKVKGARTFVQI